MEVEQQNLVAIISGGAYQQFGRDHDLLLDGSHSYDPDDDENTNDFNYDWSCAKLSSLSSSSSSSYLEGSFCNMSEISNITLNTSSLLIQAGRLPISEYEFRLRISMKEHGTINNGTTMARNDTATVRVGIVSGAPPIISIDTVIAAKYNSEDTFLRLVC